MITELIRIACDLLYNNKVIHNLKLGEQAIFICFGPDYSENLIVLTFKFHGHVLEVTKVIKGPALFYGLKLKSI